MEWFLLKVYATWLHIKTNISSFLSHSNFHKTISSLPCNFLNHALQHLVADRIEQTLHWGETEVQSYRQMFWYKGLPSDDAAPSPHQSDGAIVEAPAKLFGSLSQQHETLGVRDDLGGIEGLDRTQSEEHFYRSFIMYTDHTDTNESGSSNDGPISMFHQQSNAVKVYSSYITFALLVIPQ